MIYPSDFKLYSLFFYSTARILFVVSVVWKLLDDRKRLAYSVGALSDTLADAACAADSGVVRVCKSSKA
jgi:hypothetical protein